MNFNEELILRSRKTKYIKSLIAALTFTAFGIKLIHTTGSIAGWIIVLFFGFAAIASLIPVLPKQSYLKIDLRGFTVRSMFQTIKINWHEVENFEAVKRNFKSAVTYSYKNKTHFNYMNVENIFGKKEVLPDVYGMEAKELAELLERFRIKSRFANFENINHELI